MGEIHFAVGNFYERRETTVTAVAIFVSGFSRHLRVERHATDLTRKISFRDDVCAVRSLFHSFEIEQSRKDIAPHGQSKAILIFVDSNNLEGS